MFDEAITKDGKDVILQEAGALKTLAKELPEYFAAVVKLILVSKVWIIVSGVGKSGHIARKIAATPSSSGSPRFFMHATEASHALPMAPDLSLARRWRNTRRDQRDQGSVSRPLGCGKRGRQDRQHR